MIPFRSLRRVALCTLALSVTGCDDDSELGSDTSAATAALPPCAERGGDRDLDQVCDADDNCPDAANSDQMDTDGDGAGDACDPTPGRCDDHGLDADEDGACDFADNCVGLANPDQRDVDGDGLGDECDPSVGLDVCAGTGGDADEDGVCQAGDNCPDDENAGQRDSDMDGLGDACDPTPQPCDGAGGDTDGDRICDPEDNCPEVANATQLDRDGDLVGDACDDIVSVPNLACDGEGGDDDGDKLCGLIDNCPDVPNLDQADTDGDGIGDACDEEECDGIDNDGDGEVDEGMEDTDGDGNPDCTDPCPDVADGDEDGDGLLDCADPCLGDPSNDVDGDGICGAVDNCPDVPNSGYRGQADRDGDGIGDACDVEECDGISNDADNTIDEGMADEDSDGLCDAIDPCLGDPSNDVDGDGVCGATDNCPNTPNPQNLDTDGDGIGDVCDLDANCSAPAPLVDEALPAADSINNMEVGPDRNTLYVLTNATAVPYSSELLAVDLPSRRVQWRLVIGGDPNLLELSSDGSRAWVTIAGSSSIRMIDLESRRRCGEFMVWSDDRTVLTPTSLTALPGSPESLIVRSHSSSPFNSVARVFDSGRARPKSATSDGAFIAGDATTMYSHDRGSSLKVHTIGPEGFDSERSYAGVLRNDPALFHNGRLYTTTGVIVDVAFPRVIADLPTSGAVAVSGDGAHLYYATSGSFPNNNPAIQVWDAQTLFYVGDLALPPPPSRVRSARKFATWGDRGAVVLFNGDFFDDPDVLMIVDEVQPEPVAP